MSKSTFLRVLRDQLLRYGGDVLWIGDVKFYRVHTRVCLDHISQVGLSTPSDDYFVSQLVKGLGQTCKRTRKMPLRSNDRRRYFVNFSPNMGSPLFDSALVASSWITSQCSRKTPSLMRRMSAAIQFVG